jgi:hypothetical protein
MDEATKEDRRVAVARERPVFDEDGEVDARARRAAKQQAVLADRLHATRNPGDPRTVRDGREGGGDEVDEWERLKDLVSDDDIEAATTCKRSLLNEIAKELLKEDTYGHWTRNGKSKYSPAGVLALLTATGGGCCSHALTARTFMTQKGIVEAMIKSSMLPIAEALASALNPTTMTANLPKAPAGPATRPSAIGCYRCLPLGTELKMNERERGKLPACVFVSQKFGTECVKLIVAMDRNHLIINGGLGPGSVNETRLLYTSPQTGVMATTRHVSRDGRRSPYAAEDVMMHVVVGEEFDIIRAPAFLEWYFASDRSSGEE